MTKYHIVRCICCIRYSGPTFSSPNILKNSQGKMTAKGQRFRKRRKKNHALNYIIISYKRVRGVDDYDDH